MSELVKLIIVSHKRPNGVKSIKAFSNAAICIADNQYKEYKKYNPGAEYIIHPNNVIGLAAKYKWIYKEFKNIAIIGDDIDYLKRNYLGDNTDKKSIISAELAYEIIQETASLTKQMESKLFAFSKESNPITYAGFKPFRLTGIASGGVIGILDGFEMRITERCVSGLDYFLSGLNAYYHRTLFVDERYNTYCKEGTFVSQGGMSDFRTIDTERKDLDYLKELFGDAIVLKTNDRLRKLKHQYEKSLKIPF